MPSISERSERMVPDGYFYDGMNSERHLVRLALDNASQSLLLLGPDGPVERWPYGEIRLVERAHQGYPVRYRRADWDGQRLTSRFDSLTLLEPVCPNLRKLPARERRTARLAGGIGAAVLGLVILLLYSLPRFAGELAAVFPAPLEQRLGSAADKTVRTLLGNGTPVRVCRSSDGSAALRRLSIRLANAAGMAKPPLVQVIDTPVLNAVALPGNRVLVFRGLLQKVPDGNALAGVLGHEFGHIAYRHPLKGVIRQSGLSVVIGLLAGDIYGASLVGGAALVLLNSAYSREDEADADRAALSTLAAAGIDSDGLAEFFRMVAREQRDAGLGKMPVFIMGHPDTGDREAMIRRDGRPGGEAMSDTDWAKLKAICDSES